MPRTWHVFSLFEILRRPPPPCLPARAREYEWRLRQPQDDTSLKDCCDWSSKANDVSGGIGGRNHGDGLPRSARIHSPAARHRSARFADRERRVSRLPAELRVPVLLVHPFRRIRLYQPQGIGDGKNGRKLDE